MSDGRSVYRLYDADDRLLYVGSTVHVPRRLREHHSKPWWHLVARHEAVDYPTAADAVAAEESAIDHEGPIHNRNRASGQTVMRTMRADRELWDAVKAQAGREGTTVTRVLVQILHEYVRDARREADKEAGGQHTADRPSPAERLPPTAGILGG